MLLNEYSKFRGLLPTKSISKTYEYIGIVLMAQVKIFNSIQFGSVGTKETF